MTSTNAYSSSYTPPNTDQRTEQRTYHYPQCGPWGITLSDELNTQARLNTSFSQRAWADAKQNGCQPPPGESYPSWPPPRGDGFVYPTLSKKPQELMTLGEDVSGGFGQPFSCSAPRSADRYQKFWEQGANPAGCPMDQAVAGPRAQGCAQEQSNPQRDLSYAVANRIASEMLGGRND